mmetsp:Transcript_69058/g.121961  ORF Transcript_69058/g.121961 Transcript_69058/m.121961 type:complete len:201 (-) Transcript_69058:10351-10953(-)
MEYWFSFTFHYYPDLHNVIQPQLVNHRKFQTKLHGISNQQPVKEFHLHANRIIQHDCVKHSDLQPQPQFEQHNPISEDSHIHPHSNSPHRHIHFNPNPLVHKHFKQLTFSITNTQLQPSFRYAHRHQHFIDVFIVSLTGYDQLHHIIHNLTQLFLLYPYPTIVHVFIFFDTFVHLHILSLLFSFLDSHEVRSPQQHRVFH